LTPFEEKKQKKGNSKLKGSPNPIDKNLNGYKLSYIANATLTSMLLYQCTYTLPLNPLGGNVLVFTSIT
jgi:hypothetical protein